MQIIEPSAELFYDFDGAEYLRLIERAGRICYKSEKNITADSAEKFVRMLIRRGHESVLEHCSVSFKIICDRGVMAELTRHRLASFSVESTRYVKYDDLEFIKPVEGQSGDWDAAAEWLSAMKVAERAYSHMLKDNPPEIARSVLPLSLKTEMIMTANLREWRHILKLRTSSKAHPQMRQVAGMILAILKEKLPVVFEDIGNAD